MILYTNCYRWANVDRTNEIKKDAQITFYQICFLYVYASAQVVSVAVEFAKKVARKQEWELPKVVVVKYEGNGGQCSQVLGFG